MAYGTAVGVLARTGARPDDFGLDDDAALTAFLGELLDEATDLMNRRMRRDWTTEDEVPAGLNGIANDIVATAVREMVASRQTPVVRIDDFAIRTVSSRLFTPDILQRLRLYASSGAGTIDVMPGDVAEQSTDALFAHELDALDSEPGSGL